MVYVPSAAVVTPVRFEPAELKTLTDTLASGVPLPWAVTDAPADYIEKMVGAIVGIEIAITRLLGKWKVSQNQPPANQASLTRALSGTPMGELIRQQQQQ